MRRVHDCLNYALIEDYIDVSTIITRATVERVYELVSEAAGNAAGGSGDPMDGETVDPNHHFFVIDAFEMPNWQWSIERKTFEKYVLLETSSTYPACGLPS